MSNDCIFCRIIAGDLPCVKVYEDKDVVAFMDIGPVVKGHTLVAPKIHHENIMTVPVAVLKKAIAAVQKVAQAQENGLKADGVNITQANGKIAGQVVPHIHFHVIPRFTNDGHSWNSPQKKYEGGEEMEKFARAIRKGMGGGPAQQARFEGGTGDETGF